MIEILGFNWTRLKLNSLKANMSTPDWVEILG